MLKTPFSPFTKTRTEGLEEKSDECQTVLVPFAAAVWGLFHNHTLQKALPPAVVYTSAEWL